MKTRDTAACCAQEACAAKHAMSRGADQMPARCSRSTCFQVPSLGFLAIPTHGQGVQDQQMLSARYRHAPHLPFLGRSVLLSRQGHSMVQLGTSQVAEGPSQVAVSSLLLHALCRACTKHTMMSCWVFSHHSSCLSPLIQCASRVNMTYIYLLKHTV